RLAHAQERSIASRSSPERIAMQAERVTRAGIHRLIGKQLPRGWSIGYTFIMVIITFQDRAAERKALAFLLGRFSGRVLKTGEHLVPDAALEALAQQNIPFTVTGKASYAQQVAARGPQSQNNAIGDPLRGTAPAPVQRRPRRSGRVAG